MVGRLEGVECLAQVAGRQDEGGLLLGEGSEQNTHRTRTEECRDSNVLKIGKRSDWREERPIARRNWQTRIEERRWTSRKINQTERAHTSGLNPRCRRKRTLRQGFSILAGIKKERNSSPNQVPLASRRGMGWGGGCKPSQPSVV